MTCACNVVSSDKVTVICSALAITWLLVTISPDGSMIKPEPSEAARGGPEPPGAALLAEEIAEEIVERRAGDSGRNL